MPSEGWYHYEWPVPGGLLPRWKSSFVRNVRAPSGENLIVGAGMYDDAIEKAFVVDAVTRAVAAIEAQGEAAFAGLRDPSGPYIFKDPYVFVIEPDGVESVNPAFPNLEGKNVMDVTDAEGKRFVREFFATTRSGDGGWVQYQWPRPGEAVSTLKSTYVKPARMGNRTVLVGCGAYLANAPRAAGRAATMTAPQLMALVCASLEQDAQLTALGRVIARADLLRLLRHRLQFVEIFRQHPEISAEQIVAPVFILGMPRTGTTSLHELLALDPQFRVPRTWELAYPFPPPEAATDTTDPRIAKVAAELARVDRLLPEFKHMHPMGAELPQECVALFAHDFVSMIFDVQFRLTGYQEWLIREDMGEVFRNHRRWLQLLQWKAPGDTWVLKSPQYLWNIDEMLREYTDARVVQMHRDPSRCRCRSAA